MSSLSQRERVVSPDLGPADRDQVWFDDIYDRHFAEVSAYALRRCAHADAYDVVAEVFLVAWRRRDAVPDDGVLPWLYGVARNVIRTQRRTRRRRDRLMEKLTSRRRPHHSEPLEGAPDEVLAALDRLSYDDRELLRLVAWEGCGPIELAQILGCSRNAAAIRVHRARTRLRANLNGSLDDTKANGTSGKRPDDRTRDRAREGGDRRAN